MESGFGILGRLANRLMNSFFPRFCLRCGVEGGLWCEDCDSVYVPVVVKAGCPFCGEGGNSTCGDCSRVAYLDGVTSVVSYADPIVREGVKIWKYNCDRSMEEVVRRWVARCANRINFPNEDFVVAPIPLHVTKRRSRGFNQAEVVAEIISDRFGLSYENLLKRKVKTTARAKMAQDERRVGEMDGVFELQRFDPPKCVLLCDDVFTSGSTMDSAARCLKKSGVEIVWGLTLAKG